MERETAGDAESAARPALPPGAERAGGDGQVVFTPIDWADVELRIPNVEKGRELLGWEPRVELDDGLARTIAWYRAKQPASA